MKNVAIILLVVMAPFSLPGLAVETEPIKKSGLTLQLASDQNAVIPGETITIGLFIVHEPTYHTYWKSPGVVGVPTSLKWKMPIGFTAEELRWPAPQRTKMLQLTAYGYETDTCLLTTIHVPETVSEKTVTLKVRAGWMCCATACYPDGQDFEITLPVASAKSQPERDEKWAAIFAKNTARFPKKTPTEWKFTATKAGPEIDAAIDICFSLPESITLPEGFDWNQVYFFCHDNQVNSDEPQIVKATPEQPRTVSIHLIGTDFGPENAKTLSGVLFSPKGWPGLDTKWIEVSTSWPKQ